jgi:hypothetical protein
MKKTEKILAVLLIVSFILKYTGIPIGSIILTLAGFAMGIYYLLGSFLLFNDIRLRLAFRKDAYRGIGVKEILISILAGLSLFSFIMGLLFLANRWPGAKAMLMGARSWSILCTVLCTIFLIIKRHPTYNRVLWRILPVTVFCILLLVLFK